MFDVSRAFCKCKVLSLDDIENYYQVPESSYDFKVSHLKSFNDFQVFGDVKTNDLDEHYIEIIFYNRNIDTTGIFKRFIIQKGYMLEEYEEMDFLMYVRDANLYMREEDYYDFLNKIHKYCPECHVRGYTTESLRMFLEHIYYANHRSGAREILYKAELPELAYYIDSIQGYNIIGSNPEEIIGMPLKLIRYILSIEGCQKLFDAKEREHILSIYKTYSGYFNTKIGPSIGQFAYLENLKSFGDGNVQFNKEIYDNLSSQVSDYFVEACREYYYYASLLGDLNPYPENPDLDEIFDAVDDMKEIFDSINDENKLDADIRKHNDPSRFAFEDEDYIIVTPTEVREFIREANAQRNCLRCYVERVASGNTNIVFVRRKNRPKDSFVTMEIHKNTITQFRGIFNTVPAVKTLEFIGKFADHYNLSYEPIRMLLSDRSVLGLHPEENDFITERIRKKGYPSWMRKDLIWNQISMFDIYPEMEVEDDVFDGF